MQPIRANITRALPVGSRVETCDNSGAKLIKIFTVVGLKTVKKRISSCGVGDLIMASVVRGRPDMRKQVVFAVIVRQKREYRRPDGMRIKFEDNSAVVLKDDKGNPKGTMLKGPIAKEVTERWPAVAKIASIVV
ncbi:50S ribosomal protein L14 [Candidatus Woesearchaeota archaeon]|nr:50S ribosomal protein L14 [Candidatus Woesearchaeota archaeon]MBI2130926.1 50S ribosomal protein L14 [Candidatus Woesearchaeota archaeon]